MEPKEKRAFEPTGLVPRSIVRTFERFRQQLLPGSERAAIREYRISRYQVLVSARCLLILLTIPIATNWFVSSWLLSPLIEHFWNTQQNEVFLNSYQEERAFAELEFFSDKLFFESLLSNDNDVPKEQNDYRLSKTKNPQEHFLPVFVTSLKYPSISSIWCLAKKITSAQSPDSFLEKEKRANVVRGTEADKNTVAASLIVDLNLRPNMETDHGTATLSSLGSHSSDFSEKGLLERKKKFSMPIYDDFLFTENTDYIKKSSEIFDCTDKMDFSDKIKATEQLKNTNILKKDKEFSFSSYPTFANSMRSVLYATQQKSKEQLMAVACCPCFYRTAVPTVCSGAKKHFLPQVVPGKKHAPLACSLVAKHESERTASPRTACFFPGTTLPSTGCSGKEAPNEQAKKRTLNINNTENSLKIKEKIQEKILELAVYYNQQTILSITNIAGDFISLFTLACLFIWMKPEISILKSFLIEAIYSLSDTTKSFLLILLTDLLVGFHSPRGWETALELLLKHLGLPENQDFVFLFVATFPVLLDTVFKYWIFRHLNKISPSTVATYHSMIE